MTTSDRPAGIFVNGRGRGLLLTLAWGVLFSLFTLLVALHGTVRFDRGLAEFLSGLPHSVDLFFAILCRSGNIEIELPILLLLGFRLWKRDHRTHRILLFLLAALFAGSALEHFLKMHLPPYAPPDAFQHDPLSGWDIFFPVHYHVIASFPSGHTFRVLLILLFTRIFYPERFLPVFLWGLGIIVGVIVLGWHWSSDTLGSFFLAGAIWAGTGSFREELSRSGKPD